MAAKARILEKYVEYVEDSAGNAFSPASGAQSYTYNANGDVATITCVGLDGITRVRTLTYTGTVLSGVSQWVVTP